jgi:hypothetical protein
MLRWHESLWAAGKEISKEEGVCSLTPSSTVFLRKAVWVSSSECSGDINEQRVGCELEQLYLNMQSQSVCSRCLVSDVINSGLSKVITPSTVLSEVVVRAACTLTTSSMLGAVGCVGGDAQRVLVATSSAVCTRFS